MKILFITSTRLGDGVLSTGALAHFIREYPEAEITVACGPLIAGIFEQAPHVVRVISLEKSRYALHWQRLWMETAGIRWDIVVDLRNSLMSRMIRARKKYVWGKQDKRRHKVEQLADVIGVSPPPAPTLWFGADVLKKAESLVPPGGPVLGIGPAANWPGKMWPAESFVELARRLTVPNAMLAEARIAVFAAPGEEETARRVLDAMPPEKRVDVVAKASPVVAAAALQRCAFYVGNDSGLMHCAAAAGTPTLGLFGPSWPHLYRPWGPHCAYVSTPETYDELTSYPGYDVGKVKSSLMTSLTVDMAEAAAKTLWEKLKR